LMKILLLSKKFPFPLRDGESQAIHGLSKSLSELGVEVCLLAMNTKKHFYANKELPEEMSHFREVRTVNINTDIRLSDALRNLVKGTSYHLSRFDNQDYHHELRRWLTEEDFDVVQLETLYLAPYLSTIRQYSNALVAMRSHNVEHEIWERISSNVSFAPKRWYLQHLTQQLRTYELARLNDYDLLLPITQRDERHFQSLGFQGRSLVVPIGLDTGCGEPDYDSYRQAPNLSFIGSLDWLPNLEGLHWFLDKDWPELHRLHPQLKFHIAGRNMPASMLKMKRKNVVVHGEVPDACTFVNQHSISLVPLLSGSGMRAKILEAMSLGRTVVTTSIGLEGIQADHGKDVLIANTPQDFIAVLSQCLNREFALEKIGRAAHMTFSRRYDRIRIADKLLRTYHRNLARKTVEV